MVEKIKMTKEEAGRRGGEATLRNHGLDHYKELGKKGGEKAKQVWQKFKESQKQ